jgi:hypothetical protein
MSSPSSRAREGDNAKQPDSSTGSIISYPPLPIVRPCRGSFLNLPAELRCIVYKHFTPEDLFESYTGESPYGCLLQLSKGIRKEALTEMRKVADKYYLAFTSHWVRKDAFGIKIEPIINPVKVTVVISQSFAKITDSSQLLVWPAPLLSMQLDDLTFDISRALSNLDAAEVKGILCELFYSMEQLKPQAQRTTIDWGPSQSSAMADGVHGLCKLVGKCFYAVRMIGCKYAAYNWVLKRDDGPHQGDQGNVSGIVGLSFHRKDFGSKRNI